MPIAPNTRKRRVLAAIEKECKDLKCDRPERKAVFAIAVAVKVRMALEKALKALELCNESRSRLTRFATEPDHWINEALAELGPRE